MPLNKMEKTIQNYGPVKLEQSAIDFSGYEKQEIQDCKMTEICNNPFEITKHHNENLT